MQKLVLLCGGTAIALFTFGCPGQPDPEPHGRCVVDAQRVAARADCVFDETCPCGTHCELGQCTASCAADDDCGGGVCDDFGRCRAIGDPALVPAPSPVKAARIVPSPQRLRFRAQGDVVRLQLGVRDRAAGPMRVAVPAGYSVSCSGSAFGPECSYPGIGVLESRTVEVRLDEDLDAVGPGSLRVFHGPDRYGVGLQPVAPPGETDPSGVYAGTVRLTEVGVAGDATHPVVVEGLRAEVTAEVYADGGTGVIVLSDPQGGLTPNGALTGSMVIGDETQPGAVDWPTFVSLDGTALAGLDTTVMVSPVTEELTRTGLVPTLNFDLTLRYSNISDTGRDPVNVYRVALTRTGDLEDASLVPDVPVDEPLPTGTATRADRSDWEDAVQKTLLAPEGILPDEAEALFGFGTSGNLALCADDPNRRALIISKAAEAFYTTEASGPISPEALLLNSDDPVVQAVAQALSLANVPTVVSLSATFDSPETLGMFPCQTSPGPGLPGGADLGGKMDFCDEVARAYGCTVQRFDAPSPLTVLSLHLNGGDYDLVTEVERVCVFDDDAPLGPAGCSQQTLCYALPAELDGAYASSASTLVGDSVDGSGDLRCLAGPRSAGNTDAQDTGAMFGVFAACLEDLESARSAVVVEPSTFNSTGLDTLFAHQGCLDAARFAFALGQASAVTRRADDEPAPDNDVEAYALAQRMMQSWLTLHSLVAREGEQLEPLLPILELENQLSPDTALDVSLDGWHLFLHPRFFAVLDEMPAALLYAPDYRTVFAGLGDAVATDAEVGLPALMLETLQAQVQLLERMLQRAHREGQLGRSQNVLDQMAEFLRTEALVRGLATQLFERARQYAADQGLDDPAWTERYAASAQAYSTALDGLAQSARNIQLGRNALGIEDGDLPLYFLGDEASATSRFTAISDYLLGVPGSPTAWAPRAVAEADAALSGARSAGLALQQRQFEQALSDVEQARRLDDIRRTFGTEVINYCGLPEGLDPLDVLEDWPREFNALDCYLNSDDPICRPPLDAYEAALNVDDVRFQFCVLDEMRSLTDGAIASLEPAYDLLGADIQACNNTTFPAACADPGDRPCVSCEWSVPAQNELLVFLAEDDYADLQNQFPTASRRQLFTAYCADNEDAFLCGCRRALMLGQPLAEGCRGVPVSAKTFFEVDGLSGLPTAVREEAKAKCKALYPSAREDLPGPDELPAATLPPRDCFNGGIGEKVLELRGIATDLDVANAEASELEDAYTVATESCIIQQEFLDELGLVQSLFFDEVEALQEKKDNADLFSKAFDFAGDCLNGLSAVEADDPNSKPKKKKGKKRRLSKKGAAGLGACAADLGQEAAEFFGIKLYSEDIREAEARHENLVLELETQLEQDLCFQQAEIHLVGARTASLRVQKAIQELSLGLYQLGQAISAAQSAHDAGRAALVVAGSQFRRPASHDYWFDENVDTYLARMKVARRLVYLAVRAVEYEFQASLSARQDVLAAQIPGDLESVINELRSVTATRNIAGNRPTDLKVVLSLKKQLLQLADQAETQPEGWQALSDVERLRLLLRSQRYASYDREGKYMGQTIPFDLAPLGTLGLGNENQVSVFTSNDCAERLWGVNASIAGNDLYRGDAPSFVRIDLLKSNTFYSQWCGAGDGDFQTASVRPSRNLFREPGQDESFGELLGGGDETDQMSRARIQAYFNVGRQAFERDEYAGGSTSELAARGLYGQYALFFPSEVLSDAPGKDGLLLNNIDDILIRLDYVSVAK